MKTVITALFAAALLTTLGVLLAGVFVMSRGGDLNRRWGNRLMRLRVICQAVAIALFALMVLVGQT